MIVAAVVEVVLLIVKDIRKSKVFKWLSLKRQGHLNIIKVIKIAVMEKSIED